MKNIVNANEFLKAISKVSKVLPKKTSLPILKEIKVEFKENKCILTGTDIEQIIISEIEANGDNFSFVFNDTKSIIKASKYFENDLEFIYEDNKIIMNSNGKSCKQIIESIEGYPEVPKMEIQNVYDTNSTDLLNRYNKIKYAISDNEAKPILNGVCFKNDKMVALDGFRMAMNTDANLIVNNEIIVPQNALNLLSIYDKNVSLQMQVNHKYLIFTDKNTKLISRLIEGDYVKFEQIIPQESKEECNIDIRELENGLKYLKEFVNSKNNKVKFEKGILSTKNENGEYTTNVEFGQDSNIIYGFNCKYMLDALKQFKDEKTIDYKIISSVAPMVFTNENDLALMLPVRLQNIA